MTDSGDPLVLTDALDRWDLTLRTGETIAVWAHAVAERDGNYVFVALMQGAPHFELELCSVPKAVVAELLGG